MNSDRTLWWDENSSSIMYIEQTLLPGELKTLSCREIERWAAAIRRLEVRGAPALGVAGGYGIALAAVLAADKDLPLFMEVVKRDATYLRNTRPTAINLAWGIDRVLGAMAGAGDVETACRIALDEAEAIAREDTASCRAIGELGAILLPDRCTVLTHCNAGALACSSWGTALGVIRSAIEMGKDVKVIACETRPLLQGARLTAWELARDGIDVTVITDSTAAYVMQKQKVDAMIVGADRITRDTVFNKIGTYMHAICARYHGIPFYVAAPVSTFDFANTGKDVIVEKRDRSEVAVFGNRVTVPEAARILNFGFDKTPLDLVSAVITDTCVLHPPYDISSLAGSQVSHGGQAPGRSTR